MDLTVAIPTYNGEHRLPDVLAKLKICIDYCVRSRTENQSNQSFTWEIIVVDNNSTDNTAQVVRDYQASWALEYPLKYYFAPEQGAAFARQKAVEKAAGTLIAFLDDDNLPAPDWVYAAYKFGQEHPKVGAYGSQIHADFFEQKSTDELPANFQQISCFLAIVERGDKAYQYEPRNKILPPAAGLVVRREAWLQTVPQRLVLNHTGKEAGLASEDLEALLHIQQGGWEIWYNPAMVVRHKIPNARLKKEYLRLLVRCVGLSRHRLRMMTLKNWQRPLAFPAYMANDLRRLVLHLVKHRHHIHTDTVAACQREFLSSSMQSPFFLWKKEYIEAIDRKNKLKYTKNTQDYLNKISEAFEQDLFRLYYQQISPVSESELEQKHGEILLRLEEKTGEILLPKHFLPTAELHNLMGTIDRLVVRKLLAQLSNSKGDRSIYEINLSSASINDRQFIRFLEQELSNYSISPEQICFSISEKIATANLEQVMQLVTAFKAMGCSFALDKFGRQNNNADYLQQISADYLKIDGNLVQNIVKNANRVQFEQINYWGQARGMKTIAEYVENKNTLLKIKTMGVDYIQGYEVGHIEPLKVSL